ncbi:unnamed protein product [Malus baccata var. baccata]
MMMNLLITEDPGMSIDVYLRPLVDELKDLWTHGVRTYDKCIGKMFTLRAAVMWTVNDFPAYVIVSGWSTRGYMACPVCKEDVTSSWHAGKVCYLEKDNEFDGEKEHRLRPREWFGAHILEQLNRLDFAHFGTNVTRTRPATHMNWTHKSMFFELPYWSKLKLRHNLDVMHVEKKYIEGKTKDTIKARLDLERMGMRRGLWMNRDNYKARRDLAFFFPDRYASNIARCMNIDGGKLAGLKSHDCHVVLQRLLPVEEALLTGPVSFRWMYPIERLLGDLKKSVRNKVKPEGSIIQDWVSYEELTFCGMYLKDVETTFNRPPRNNDGVARPFGDPICGESFSKKNMDVAHWFVLNNCDETLSHLDKHENMMKQAHPSHLYAKKHRELFPQWFLEYVNQLKASNSHVYSEELYNLTFRPIRVELYSGCHVNGVKFLVGARDDKLCTQNNSVHVPGGDESTDIEFYGKLTMILFKCRWFDTHPNRHGSVKTDHGLLSVNTTKNWYDDDPYILATMAKQIVYLDDPKSGKGWKVVQKMDHRNVYAIPEQDRTDDDINNVANQRLESFMESGVETLQDTNLIQEPFQIDEVSSIEIPIQSITIDLGNIPRDDGPVRTNDDGDVPIDDKEWDTEKDDSNESESYYSSD